MQEHSSVQQWGSTSVYLITLFATVHHVTIVKSLFLTTYMTKRGGSFDAWKKDFDNVGAVSFFKPRLSIPCTWCYKTSNKAPACLWFYAPFSLRRQNSPVTDNFVGVSGYPTSPFLCATWHNPPLMVWRHSVWSGQWRQLDRRGMWKQWGVKDLMWCLFEKEGGGKNHTETPSFGFKSNGVGVKRWRNDSVIEPALFMVAVGCRKREAKNNFLCNIPKGMKTHRFVHLLFIGYLGCIEHGDSHIFAKMTLRWELCIEISFHVSRMLL